AARMADPSVPLIHTPARLAPTEWRNRHQVRAFVSVSSVAQKATSAAAPRRSRGKAGRGVKAGARARAAAGGGGGGEAGGGGERPGWPIRAYPSFTPPPVLPRRSGETVTKSVRS